MIMITTTTTTTTTTSAAAAAAATENILSFTHVGHCIVTVIAKLFTLCIRRSTSNTYRQLTCTSPS